VNFAAPKGHFELGSAREGAVGWGEKMVGKSKTNSRSKKRKVANRIKTRALRAWKYNTVLLSEGSSVGKDINFRYICKEGGET